MLQRRYRRIVWFFARILASLAFWDLLLPRIGLKSWTIRTRSKRLRVIGARFRKNAIHLGGVMIKVGQFLSTRVDVLPQEITSELAGLQDEVPPVSFTEISQVAEPEMGMPLLSKFSEFDVTPIAAASLGQAHHACLLPEVAESMGFRDVVVKVQRPNIELIIKTDLAALHTVGQWLRRYPPIRRRANVPALLQEFERTLYEEIDYLSEGRYAEMFAENFKDYPGVRVPTVVWSHTTRRVLTLEDVRGIKISDYSAIEAARIKREDVASRLLDTYLKQIFEDGFFHADPHPGNLFVSPLQESQDHNGRSWLLTFIDFGMVGHLPQNMRTGLRELVIGVGTRDAPRVIKAYQMLDVLLPGADLELIERAETEIFNRFWGKSMSEMQQISVEEVELFAHEFRELLYALPFQIPQDMIYLGRTVGILSGMCTGLDSSFNIWSHLTPFAQKLILEEASKGRSPALEVIIGWLRNIARLPIRMEGMLDRVDRGDLVVRNPELNGQVQRLEQTINRLIASIIFAALVIGSIQLYLAGMVAFSIFLGVCAGFALLGILINRSEGV
jgi:predicted unusual protein kinase regulating ubiquinone biosynthesis (AarF/ABC1/UbiB family)